MLVARGVSLGIFFADYQQTNQWYFTDILTDVQDNPHFVDLRVDSADVYYHYRNRTTGVNDSILVPVRNLAATKNGLKVVPATIDIRADAIGRLGVERLIERLRRPDLPERIRCMVEPELVESE